MAVVADRRRAGRGDASASARSPIAAPIYLGGGFSPWSLAVAAFALLAGFFALPRQGRLRASPIGVSTAFAGAAYALLFGVVVPSLSQIWLSPRIAEAVRGTPPLRPSGAGVGRFSRAEPGVPDRDEHAADWTPTAPRAISLADPACALALVPATSDGAFRRPRLAAWGKPASA